MTIQLVANCMDWAKHRRRKAAAKMHLRSRHGLVFTGALPWCVRRQKRTMRNVRGKVCAGIHAGEIVVFDRAYADYKHLSVLDNARRVLGDAGQVAICKREWRRTTRGS